MRSEELSDREAGAAQRQRRDDGVDARAVLKRASTIGVDSSMRRPSGVTMRSMSASARRVVE